MFTEEERAKWKALVERWRNGEKVFDAGRRVEQADNTSVQKQEPVLPIKRDFVAEATRKHAAEAIGPDTRSLYLREQSQSAKQYVNQLYQKAKDDAKRVEGMELLMKTMSPSTYVEAATGLDLGTAGRLITDAAAFGLPGAAKSIAGSTMQYGRKFLLSQMMRPLNKNMPSVAARFRNSEWNNFLSTKNGDFYYRMAKTAENGTKSANENYFISHTTPWEEFAGMNIGAQNASALTGEVKNGILHLYEFPTKTFGQLKSSSWEGVLGDTNVSTMGKKHLLFGNTSSGPRGPVRVLSDKNAEYLGTSPYKIGVSERPLTNNGMYDKSPVYEDIHMGNLTVISGDKLNSALNNTTYNHYYPVQGGIQKELHVTPKKTSTPALILWIDAQKPLSAKDVPTIEWSEATAPRITPDNAASITPAQWTAAQDAAIARGDMAEAQRLRDLHFMAKTPNNKITSKLYHGTDATWTEYNPGFFSSGSGDQGVFGKGLYLSQYPEVSKRYGKNMMELYAYSKNPYTADRGFELFDDAAYAFNRYENSEKLFPVLKGKDAVTSPRMVMEGGWKFHYEPNEEVVIPRGEQIKSADAVTYDSKGVRIPLGKRDNFNINDIRYGIIPLISGSTGYGLYNKYAE